jgi:hypothetical protein
MTLDISVFTQVDGTVIIRYMRGNYEGQCVLDPPVELDDEEILKMALELYPRFESDYYAVWEKKHVGSRN